MTHAYNGVELITSERDRQSFVLGYDAVHDQRHDNLELIEAAYCYLMAARWIEDGSASECKGSGIALPARWPWNQGSWKPSDDVVRNLVKAGALIASEIDRLIEASGE